VWTTGDATAAYATLQPADRLRQVTRDVVFIDSRYLVVRDRVRLADPGKVTWLLHTERTLTWDDTNQQAFSRNGRAALTVRLLGDSPWNARVDEGFPVAVDPRYVSGEANYTTTAPWNLQQNHLYAQTASAAADHTILAVLWPEHDGTAPAALHVTRDGDMLTIRRPDGRTDTLTLNDDVLDLR
jgi:hypothetical protein